MSSYHLFLCLPCLLPPFHCALHNGFVTSFKYLGSVLTDEGSKLEILSGMAQATAALTRLKPVWNDKSISLSSKIRLMCSLVTCIFLYACESWTLTAELHRRIKAMEIKCYRKILPISCKDHTTNEENCAKVQQAIGPYEDLTIVKRCKLQWYRLCLPFIMSGHSWYTELWIFLVCTTLSLQQSQRTQHCSVPSVHDTVTSAFLLYTTLQYLWCTQHYHCNIPGVHHTVIVT